ncbi:TatD family hydrolase [Metallosphaera cuprina]|nr:TatD family hydrolase [Metallosphaera cuprina]
MHMLFDAHCHCSQLNKDYSVFTASVSMDLETSLATLKMKGLRGVGIHPWNAGKVKIDEVKRLIERADFVGEVGLDYRLSEASKEVQRMYFEEFLDFPEKPVNVHALDAWEDAFNLVIKHEIRSAIFHWYTGPLNLLKDIEGAQYFITINPSVSFQAKHQKVVEVAPTRIILTESDGGYVYKGKLLEPTMVTEALKQIARIKGLEVRQVERIVEENFRRAFLNNSKIPSST